MSGALSDVQLTELAKKMGFNLNGIYFQDEIKCEDLRHGNYIINTSPQFDASGNQNLGTHWVCMVVTKREGKIWVQYMDPYGQPPPENLKKIVEKRYKRKIQYTTKDIQSLMDSVCGWYCCAFLHFLYQFPNRTKDVLYDTAIWLDFFVDLETDTNYKKNIFMLKLFFQEQGKSLKGLEEIFKDETLEDIYDNRITDGDKDDIKVDVAKIPIRE
jgi:hypothetical protein